MTSSRRRGWRRRTEGVLARALEHTGVSSIPTCSSAAGDGASSTTKALSQTPKCHRPDGPPDAPLHVHYHAPTVPVHSSISLHFTQRCPTNESCFTKDEKGTRHLRTTKTTQSPLCVPEGRSLRRRPRRRARARRRPRRACGPRVRAPSRRSRASRRAPRPHRARARRAGRACRRRRARARRRRGARSSRAARVPRRTRRGPVGRRRRARRGRRPRRRPPLFRRRTRRNRRRRTPTTPRSAARLCTSIPACLLWVSAWRRDPRRTRRAPGGRRRRRPQRISLCRPGTRGRPSCRRAGRGRAAASCSRRARGARRGAAARGAPRRCGTRCATRPTARSTARAARPW
mmetsp:Transcript_11518/g.46622  ORF Transcript_11518/g.46622 Transcript_11518/m.46622 type:complete len:345 (+) Transcript_11518:2347-3381(+)